MCSAEPELVDQGRGPLVRFRDDDALAFGEGGRGLAVVTVLALLAGVSLMDSAMVLLGAGAHRVSPRFLRILGDTLAIALGTLGIWLIVQGFLG